VKQAVLLDAGPLVALLDHRDQYHAWTVEQLARLRPPFCTCEAAIAEAFHLLRRLPDGFSAILEMAAERVLTTPFKLTEQSREVLALVRRYRKVPMSLADACLVRMSELIPGAVVCTFDSDFRIYRRHQRQKIPLLIPLDI
jgi:predicted nucleic acid-binding protein